MKKIHAKQRKLGLILIALAIISAVVTGGNILAALILVPLGLYMVFTKKKIIYDDVD
jgi:hypothetical protein